jgi:hypothetical protein
MLDRPSTIRFEQEEDMGWSGQSRSLGVVAAVTVIALAFTGCAKKKAEPPAPETTPAPVSSLPAPSSASPTPTPTPEETWPLTGLPGPVEQRPALAVKIENSIDARPQTGLEDADMVWEEMVEGGIPRYVAVYHSVIPKEIGPVRSVRPMDPAIVAPLHCPFAFSGGQGQFISRASKAGLQIISEDAGNKGFYRINTRYAPHNTYANPKTLLKQADKKHSDPPATQFTFAVDAAQATAQTSGLATKGIKVTISSGSHPNWAWSADKAVWLRSEGDNRAVNAEGDQLTATNVIGLMVEVGVAPGKDPAGNPIPETYLSKKSGEGFVASGGQYIEVKWSKGKDKEPIVLTTADGAPVNLAPGRTWIELIPRDGGGWKAQKPPADAATPNGQITPTPAQYVSAPAQG